MAVAICLSTLDLTPSFRNQSSSYIGLVPAIQLRTSGTLATWKRNQHRLARQAHTLLRRFVVRAATEGSAKSSQSEEKIPSWAKPDSDEPPPWARDEGSSGSSQSTFQIPFYAYLLASAIIAIAAIGSIFEYVNQKPVFGVLNSDSIFYAPVLGFFAFTGIPTSAFLWFKSVQVANEEAEEQDRRDGFR